MTHEVPTATERAMPSAQPSWGWDISVGDQDGFTAEALENGQSFSHARHLATY
jgi:hypothetical protein